MADSNAHPFPWPRVDVSLTLASLVLQPEEMADRLGLQPDRSLPPRMTSWGAVSPRETAIIKLRASSDDLRETSSLVSTVLARVAPHAARLEELSLDCEDVILGVHFSLDADSELPPVVLDPEWLDLVARASILLLVTISRDDPTLFSGNWDDIDDDTDDDTETVDPDEGG